jgi:hypothetical protein
MTLMTTATNLDRVNLSPGLEGNTDANNNVNKLADEDKTVTVLASVYTRAA